MFDLNLFFKIAELAGHTNRVYKMLHVFDECAHERYQRSPMIKEEDVSVGMKRKIVLNQQAGLSLLEVIRNNQIFNRRTNYRIR